MGWVVNRLSSACLGFRIADVRQGIFRTCWFFHANGALQCPRFHHGILPRARPLAAHLCSRRGWWPARLQGPLRRQLEVCKGRSLNRSVCQSDVGYNVMDGTINGIVGYSDTHKIHGTAKTMDAEWRGCMNQYTRTHTHLKRTACVCISVPFFNRRKENERTQWPKSNNAKINIL